MPQAAAANDTNSDDLAAFREALTRRLNQAEREVVELGRASPGSRNVKALLEVVEKVRADAIAFRVGAVVRLAKAVEELVGAASRGAFVFEPAVGEVVLLGLDRIKMAVRRAESGRPLDEVVLDRGVQAVMIVAGSGPSQLEENLRQAMQSLVGGEEWTQVDDPGALSADILDMVAGVPQQDDLKFFRELGISVENRIPYWKGRMIRQLHLAVETNAEAGLIVDPTQLEAALYMHDVGMTFISESIWAGNGPLNPEQLADLHSHPDLGAGILRRMPDWTAAAAIVEQHHERPNGRGYPNQLKNDEIVPGAKLLAILDAFEAMTQARIHRENRKSVIRAIAEVNARDDQFAREWVEPFNEVIRRMIKSN